MNDIIRRTKYTELTNPVQAIKGAILQSQQRALVAKSRAVGSLLWHWTI